MAGITNFKIYIPPYRLNGEMTSSVWGRGNQKASRPIMSFDEDTNTMAVEAILSNSTWGEIDIDALYYASTSFPYTEKSNASIVAEATDLKSDIFTSEFSGSLRSSTTALRNAAESIKAGTIKSAVVVASESRPSYPGSPDELSLCDCSAALFIGDGKKVIAEIENFYSWSEDFVDRWRLPGEKSISSGDAKFIQDYGYIRQTVATVEGLLEKTGATPEDIAHVVFYSPDVRTSRAINKKLGFPESSYPESPVVQKIGDAGTVMPFISLIETLKKATPGEYIIITGHGSGGDAILLRATEHIANFDCENDLEKALEKEIPLENYGKILNNHGISFEDEISPFTSPSILWKENRANMRLFAGKCKVCSEIQYPRQQVCNGCGSRDKWDKMKLPRRGKIFTFVHDYLPPSPNGYITMATADMEGGGRFYAQLTECNKEEVKIGMEVELTFRMLHKGDGFYNYFWKFRPV